MSEKYGIKASLVYQSLVDRGVSSIIAENIAFADPNTEQFKAFFPLTRSSIFPSVLANFEATKKEYINGVIEKSHNEEIRLSKDTQSDILINILMSAISSYSIVKDSRFMFYDVARKKWYDLGEVKHVTLGRYLSTVLGSTYLGTKEMKILSSKDAEYKAKSLLIELERNTDNHFRQGPDFFIADGRIYRGQFIENIEENLIRYSGSFPRFFLRNGSFSSIENWQSLIKHPPKHLRFITKHLANNEEGTAFRLEVSLAMSLDDSQRTKMSRKEFIYMHGVSNAGKTTLVHHLEYAMGKDGTTRAFKYEDLEGFKTAEVVKTGAIAFVDEAPDKAISENIMATLKSLSTGASSSNEEKNKQALREDYMSALVFVLGNSWIRSNDRSDAVATRMKLFSAKRSLGEAIEDSKDYTSIDDFIDKLNSEESLEATMNYLLALFYAISNEKIDNPKDTKSMIELNEKFKEENNSAISFVNEFGLENIIGYPVNYIKDKYRIFCEEEDAIMLKMKFNSTLEEVYGLTRKTMMIEDDCLTHLSDENIEEYDLCMKARERVSISKDAGTPISRHSKEYSLAFKTYKCWTKKED